jgi:SSS family solute:Na+ symporter
VLGIGFAARRSVEQPRLLPLRPVLPAWVTGLASSPPTSAPRDARDGGERRAVRLPTVHYYWVGAIPAMVFLGLVMMPFYYGAKVRACRSTCGCGSTSRRTCQRADVRVAPC